MLSKIRNMMKADEGFTLIELMVVILIIGILMAIAIPSFIAVRNRGYASAAKSNRSVGVKTMELYSTDNGGSYVGGDATALAALETAVTFVDAAGTAEQVYVHGQGTNSYIIEVLGKDGTTYTATKTNGAAVVYAPN